MKLRIEERPAPFTSRHMRVCALYADHSLRAIGHGETSEESHAKCIQDARELHESLGLWLAEQGAYKDENLIDEGVHEVAIRESCQSLHGLVAVMLHNGSDSGDYIEGHGATREVAIEKLRKLLVELHASHWHALAQALKGGE